MTKQNFLIVYESSLPWFRDKSGHIVLVLEDVVAVVLLRVEPVEVLERKARVLKLMPDLRLDVVGGKVLNPRVGLRGGPWSRGGWGWTAVPEGAGVLLLLLLLAGEEVVGMVVLQGGVVKVSILVGGLAEVYARKIV